MKFSNWFHYALMALAGIFFISPKITVIFIVLLGIVITIGAFRNQFEFKWHTSHILWASIYILYLIGAIYTRHSNLAGLYLENKVSLLLFPLFFSFKPKFELELKPVLSAAIIGYILAVFMGLLNAYSNYSEGVGLITSFTSVSISPIHHPTYMSIFGIILLAGMWQLKVHNEVRSISFVWGTSVIILIYSVLCLSLSALIFIFLIGCAFSIWWIVRKVKKPIGLTLLFLVPVLLTLTFLNVPSVKTDLNATYKSMSKYLEDPDGYVKTKTGYKTGNEIRLVMWTVTVQEILDHPFGVGTGNVDEVLSKRLESKNQKHLALKDEKGTIQFNPHNQFLQTSLEVGIIGGLLLLFTIVLWLRIGWRSGNWMLVILSLSLAFNGLFESMLQRQSGIVFYSFWSVFLVLISLQMHQKSQAD